MRLLCRKFPKSLPPSTTYRSLHVVAAAQQPGGCCLQGSGWEGVGARHLPRSGNLELGPRPLRKLPRETEAGEGVGHGQGIWLKVPKHQTALSAS